MAKWIETMSDHEDSDEEVEALSLCDLPIKLTKKTEEEELVPLVGDNHKQDSSEFEFGWWGTNHNNGSCVSSDSQMCAADELFFNGQFRLSVSSDTALLRSMSRSESLDHGSVTRFIGSRSSSIGSHYSSVSASSSNSSSMNNNYNNIHARSKTQTNNPAAAPFPKPQFQTTHPNPNPKPQMSTINNVANYRQNNNHPSIIMSQPHSSNKSTVWDFFRTGLVRGPEIELNKLRTFQKPSIIISRNNSDTRINPSPKNSSRQGLFRKSSRFLSGGSCKCSVDTVLPTVKNNRSPYDEERQGDQMTVMMMMMTSQKAKKVNVKQNKEALSRRRTNEWLKELSLSHESCSNELGITRMISRVP